MGDNLDFFLLFGFQELKEGKINRLRFFLGISKYSRPTCKFQPVPQFHQLQSIFQSRRLVGLFVLRHTVNFYIYVGTKPVK